VAEVVVDQHVQLALVVLVLLLVWLQAPLVELRLATLTFCETTHNSSN
jgi:hypothetical protein